MRHEFLNNGCRPLLRVARRSRQASSRSWACFARDQRGAIAIFVAVAIIPLIAFVGLAVDTTRGYLVKSRLNQALDAAALAGGRVFASPTRDDDIRMYFKANFPDGFMNAVTTPLVITPDNVNKTLTVTAQATMPTSFMRLVNIDTINVGSTAQVAIGATNIEVALVLDITGSMAGQDIIDLRDAANELVDIVVQDQQTPFYTKAAVAPYAPVVNVGAYAAQVRGAIAPPKAIELATKTSTMIVTAPNHGFQVNDKVYITGVQGMTQLNNNLNNDHNDTQPLFWVIRSVTTNTFTLKRLGSSTAVSSSTWNNYTSGGSIYCLNPGCQYQAFQNPSSTWKLFQVSTCVTERTGADAYTDAAPTVSPVGLHYRAISASACLSSEILPLSSDKTLLHNRINALTDGGSTAAQIGIAWGWYLVSPNFGYLWPTESQPAAYGADKLMKVVVIMTDGDFNTMYNKGVVSQDSASGSSSNRINQNATNGDAYIQANALCAAMKANDKKIVIYTVGLDIASFPDAQNFIQTCATSTAHVYLPADGAEMKDAFKDIAMKINKLRLTK